MPIYEYQCAKCKKVHEIWQKISDPPAKKCPDCGGKVERLISQSGFALKGTGWYKTDYERKSKPASKGNGDKGGEKSSEGSGSSESSGGGEKKDSSGSGSGSGSDSKAHAA